MMKDLKRTIVMSSLLVGLLAAAGCATTDDPRQGGLFGYNPEAYQRRIADREAALKSIEEQRAQQEQESVQLKETLAQKQAEKDALSAKLAQLNTNVSQIEQKIKKAKVQTANQEKQRARLAGEMKSVKGRLGELTSSSGDENVEAKRAEVEKLQRQVDHLLEEADALSKM
ncbi:MAG TPA: hypothetical protein PKV86_02405 [Syntrophobacteraceae bacterium]|nr:hypothetical protein [Syntrophobacteraceae bacterium]